MQETPLFTIRYYNSVELMFDYTKLLPAYKRTIRNYRIVSIFCVIMLVLNFLINGSDVDWVMQGFWLLFSGYVFVVPLLVKNRVGRQFKKDPTHANENVLTIFEDRIEIDNKVSHSSMAYEGILRIVETSIGVHLFFSDVKALCIPQEAIPEQTIEFLRKKIAI